MKRDKSIFVSIASYRDDECDNTISDCFLKAMKPARVFIGICQQNAKNDKDCIYDNQNEIINKFKNNIRIIRIPFYEAKGPIYARFLCSSLLDKNNEDFYFQIDSHTIFIQNWDFILISMFDEIKNLQLSLRPVISYYPKDFSYYDNDNNDNNKQLVPVINNLIFDENKKVFKLDKAIFTNTNNSYIKTFYCAAGMFFCSSDFIDVMPFDTNLDYLFTGEEIINSIKFYTNGYDIFTPKINVIYHKYTRNDKPKFWNEPLIPYDDRKALLKVRSYLFDYNNLSLNLILGKIRKVDDFYKEINININDFNYKKKNKKRIGFFIIIIFFIIISFALYLFFLN